MSRRQQRRRSLRRRSHMAIASGGLAAAVSLGTGGVARADQTFTVSNLKGSGPGSLSQAIKDVNDDGMDSAPGDKIVFASGLSGAIHLTGGELSLYGPAQILGPGAGRIKVDAASASRILYSTAQAKVSGLTFTGGAAGGGSGGAIYANGPALELDSVVVTGNSAHYGGGVSDNSGQVTISRSTISDNHAAHDGGIEMGTGNLTINDSTVSGNQGGGIFAGATVTVNDSTISGNQGGGIVEVDGTLTVNNSTVTGNTGESGAGIANTKGDTKLTDDTVAANTISPGGAGGQVGALGGGGYHLTLNDTIVSGSGSQPDVVISSGDSGASYFSLIRDATTPSGDTPLPTDASDITGKDPQLGPLQFNGGPTETMVPAPTSPVLDRGNSFGLATDQRGESRPFALPTIRSAPAGGDRSDIGAVEEHTAAITAISPDSGRGGTHVAITGTGFTGATRVLFGSIRAPSFKVLGDGAVTAVAPANVESQNVRVVTPLGESPVIHADRFTFPTFIPTIGRHPHAHLHRKKLNTGVTISCPIGGLSCAGTFSAITFIKHHKTEIANRSLEIGAGQHETITFKLSKHELKMLESAGRPKITLHFVIADGTEQPITINRAFKLKVKQKQQKH